MENIVDRGNHRGQRALVTKASCGQARLVLCVVVLLYNCFLFSGDEFYLILHCGSFVGFLVNGKSARIAMVSATSNGDIPTLRDTIMMQPCPPGCTRYLRACTFSYMNMLFSDVRCHTIQIMPMTNVAIWLWICVWRSLAQVFTIYLQRSAAMFN